MYRVRWKRGAVNDLAAIWTAANSTRRRILDVAANTIDYILQHKPGSAGESRPNNRRILFVRPLGLPYRIDDDAVRVLKVWEV